jgi:hypothetical protein
MKKLTNKILIITACIIIIFIIAVTLIFFNESQNKQINDLILKQVLKDTTNISQFNFKYNKTEIKIYKNSNDFNLDTNYK